jgi:ABC-type nitrate/sulfonate/bicarbonate transport system substrate-binding protein
MSVGGMTEVLMGIDHGAKISLLRIETQVPPYSLWGKPALKSIKELRGKIVIVGGATDVTRIYFERMAAPNGLKPGDYDLVYAGTTTARLAALVSGAADAAILYPPGSFKAASTGYAHLGELSDYVKDLPFTGYAVETKWAMQHKPVLLGFLKALHEGVAWFYDTSHRAEAVDLLVKQSGASPEDVEKTYDYYVALRVFPDAGTINAKSIGTLVDAVAQLGVLQGAPDPHRFVNPDIMHIAAEAQ